jgi:hypothetical protein
MSHRKFAEGSSDSVLLAILVAFGLTFLLSLFWVMPHYNVWSKGKNGEATLAEAEFTRKTRVAEAQAKVDASKLEATAMIVKAQAQADANRIITQTLTPAVLQSRYLDMLDEQNAPSEKTVVYIPTNASTGMPMSLPSTEAFRLTEPAKKP